MSFLFSLIVVRTCLASISTTAVYVSHMVNTSKLDLTSWKSNDNQTLHAADLTIVKHLVHGVQRGKCDKGEIKLRRKNINYEDETWNWAKTRL